MHLGHFFKKLGRGVESVFGIARQKNSGGGDSGTPSAPNTTEAAVPTAATGNAGDAVVNYTTMKKPTGQQQAAAVGNPNGTPMGPLGS